MTQLVGIVKTGVANTASVTAAIHRAGVEVTFVETPQAVDELDRIIVPGVGAFGAGMEALRSLDITDALIDRIEAGRPTFLVCLGMQLLATSSEESPGVEGLGIIDTHVGRFAEGVTTPHFGWNTVEPAASMPHIDTGYAYFANSFRIAEQPTGWTCALTDHGSPFVSAMERDQVLAAQFHPELSGSYGQSIINSWIEGEER